MTSIGLWKVTIPVTVAMTLTLLTAAPASADVIVPVSQERKVWVYAYGDDPWYYHTSDTDQATEEAEDFGPFDSALSAVVDVYYALAAGEGSQQSSIEGCRITAQGDVYADIATIGWNAFAEAYGYSYFQVSFDLTETAEVSFSGSVWSGNHYDCAGQCTVSFSRSGTGNIWSYGFSGWDGDFDNTMILEAGTYHIEASALGWISTDDNLYCSSDANFDLTMDVCPFEAGLTCDPGSGTLPFTSGFLVTIGSYEPSRPTSRVAARVDVNIASGGFISNWKAGYTQINSGDTFTTSWNQQIPLLGSVVGDNVFTLVAMDVTPPPYNQPPYNPSGFVCTNSCMVEGILP